MPSSQGIITATAPCRVDLAGGTLDIWPLYLFHPGAVTVNFAVNVFTRATVRPLAGGQIHLRSVDTVGEERFGSWEDFSRAGRCRHALAAALLRFFAPDCGLSVETDSESPAGAGISGSSALMIATTAALARFTGRKLGPEEIRVLAQNVEAQLIRVPTGCQDYYPALYGGVNAIHLDPDGIHREAIAVPAAEINTRFVIVYTGAPRHSGINNWEVFQAHMNGDRKLFHNFERIVEIARAMREALAGAAWDDVARLLREEWKLRKTNAPGISTPLIESLMRVAQRQGALAAKVCGAGGGGCIAILVEPGTKNAVVRALEQAGGKVVTCELARRGLRVTAVERTATAAAAQASNS